MATIVEYRVTSVEIEDRREVAANLIRDKIFVKTSDQVTWNQLRTMRPVPAWNDQHPREPGFYLDFVKPKQTSKLCWELEAEYTPIKAGQEDANPLSRAAVTTFESSLIEQPTFFDNQGRLITNTAGELLTGVIEQIPIVDYTVRKNLAADPRWLQTHIGGVNKESVKLRGLTWAPRTLLLGGVSGGEFTTENRQEFAQYSLKILGDPRTWSAKVWNRGTVYLKQETDRNGKKVYRQVRIQTGDPPEDVTEPVPLTLDGQVAEGYLQKSETPVDPSKLIMLTFHVQKEVSFAELPLR